MSASYGFNIGPPDDAENEAVMRIGLSARKAALKAFKAIPLIVSVHAPECNAQQVVSYQWHGMLQLAAYSLALNQYTLNRVGMEWTESKLTGMDILLDQVGELSKQFLDNMEENH